MSTFEGGVRVPTILWGPGRVPPDTTCDSIATTMDVMPTFAALAGADVPSDRVIDGEDIRHLFHGKFDQADPDKAFFYYLRVHLQAVRQGKWKLHLARKKEPVGAAPFGRNVHIAPSDRVGFEEPFLVDLEADIGETTDVSKENPQVVKRLLALAESMRNDLGDYDQVGKNMRFFLTHWKHVRQSRPYLLLDRRVERIRKRRKRIGRPPGDGNDTIKLSKTCSCWSWYLDWTVHHTDESEQHEHDMIHQQQTKMNSPGPLRLVAIVLVFVLGVFSQTCVADEGPIKVYILAGQSNMQGSAHQSTFQAIGDDPQSAPLLKDILTPDGHPVVSENAWVSYLTTRGGQETRLNGKVKVGYGFDDERIGPEYAFGISMDQMLDEPVLIIKTAWGGKSLAVGFRPPSAGPYQPSEREQQGGTVPTNQQVGHYYREMIQFVRSTLQDDESIQKVVPGYDPERGYELSGFIWFQGWNDMCNRHHIRQYTGNMMHFIRDVRDELNVPSLPFIVGILGVYGTDPDSRSFDKGLPVTDFRQAQFAAVEQYDRNVAPQYRGNVIAVDSGPYYELELSDLYWKRRLTGDWKRRVSQGKMTSEDFRNECERHGFGDGELNSDEQSFWDRCASNAEYHYLGSGKTFVRFGKALAEAMLALETK